MKNWKSIRAVFKWLFRITIVFLGLLIILLTVIFWNQEQVVQQVLTYTNQHYAGKITLKGSHIAPFANFPYVSIDLEELKVYESKDESTPPLIDVHDAYLGFDIWNIISGNYDFKAVYLSDGYFKLVQHHDGSFNIANALTPSDTDQTENTTEEEPFQLHLNTIKLHNVDIHEIYEATETDIETFVNDAKAYFKVNEVHTIVDLDARFEMNYMQNGDTTFIRHKHFEVDTRIDFNSDKLSLEIAPSSLKLESGEFQMQGIYDIANEEYLDLKIKGAKPNFNLIIAFAPEELIPTLESYDNKGEVFFEATIKGKLAQGELPKIDAKFGCKQGNIKNSSTKKELDDMEFEGYFRNTAGDGGLASMEFGLQDFKAKPETGKFSGDLKVRNFISPDIDLKLNSQFNLDFLVAFLGLKGLSDMSGAVNLTMNFHDIIDLNNPEKSIERLNESYFTELEIRDLNFKTEAFYLPMKDINLIGHIEGHEAKIDTFSAQVGNSDIFASARISDLPAIIHHTKDSIWVDLKLKSDLLDIAELTYDNSTKKAAIDEQIQDLRLDVGLNSSAFAFTESPNLPVGEFFIRELHATLKHYPHEFHDFSADVFIEDEDIRLVDFSGELDSSDFHFSGRLVHYDIWMNEVLDGDTEIEFDLTSNRLQLEDLFVYQGENYVPEDYRHEEFDNLKLHGRSFLHFKNHTLHSIDMYLDQLDCKMKLHNSRFERFKGRFHYEDQHLETHDFEGQVGLSDFHIDLYWYLGNDSTLRKTDHFIALKSKRLEINQLLEWNPPPENTKTKQVVDHDAGFTIFDLPFWDMNMRVDVDLLVYHQYKVQNLKAVARMNSERYFHIDTCYMNMAGGYFDINGYFDARDSTDIYFSPDIYVENLDIDRLLLKFDNFGQDYLVSDNLHGTINGDVTGKLHIHKDLTPMLDKSNFMIDAQVIQGRLDNYKPMEYLEDYFKDKNLKKIRFDTLENIFEFKDNVLNIPVMTINSSLGFIELWGTQSLDDNMEMDLFVKVPLKLVSRAIFQRLFKRKREDIDPDQEDAIEYKDENKKIASVNVNLLVDNNGYQVKLRKDKDLRQEQRQKRLEERRARRKAKHEGKYITETGS